MLQRKALENYQNLPEEEKTKKSEYASNRYRRLFIENELSEKKKGKRQYARDVYNNLSGENNAKGVNIRMKNIETFWKQRPKASICSQTMSLIR